VEPKKAKEGLRWIVKRVDGNFIEKMATLEESLNVLLE